MSVLALDKWARLIRIIRQNGGLGGSFLKLWRIDTLKEGKYMGQDKLGNRYFENNNYMISRSRWVEYNVRYGWNYNASQVTPEWFGWLHYRTDKLPHEDWAKYCLNCCSWCQCWLLPPEENLSGTDQAYYPYSTTPPNIQPWDGLSICNRPTSGHSICNRPSLGN